MMRNASPARHAREAVFVVTLACALVLGSCGIPEDDRPREIDPTLLEDITERS